MKLVGVTPPALQAREQHTPLGWPAFVDQVYDRFALREFHWGQEPFIPFLRRELAAGRPVMVELDNALTQVGSAGDRGWLAVRYNEVGSYFFVDLLSKHHETGEGAGQFTNRRVVRLDGLAPPEIHRVVYCEELSPDPHPRPRPPGLKRL